MDGVEHVTQCGIPPGASFTYIFKAEQYGTHWYHSHSGAQRTDGLFGALIVKEKDIEKVIDEIGDFIDIPLQHTLTLLDWQVSNSIDLFTRIHSGIRYYNIDRAADLRSNPASKRTYSSDGAEVGPVPYWSGIINGKGRHGSVPYVNSELSVFEVSPGSVYRFRLIGAQSLYAYRFSIDRHTLTVIATDGQFVVPIEVDFIIIHSGERYDFLLQTKNNTSQNDYLIRPYPKAIDYERIAKSSESDAVRCTESSNCTALNCPFLVYPQSYYISCEHIHNLRLLFPVSDTDLPTNNAKGISQTSAINGRNLRLPSSPPALYDTPENLYQESCKNLNTNWECDEIDTVIDSDCYCAHVVNVSSDHTNNENKYCRETHKHNNGPEHLDHQNKPTLAELALVDFIWINRDQRHFEWFMELLNELEMEQNEYGTLMDRFLDMHMYITSALQRTDVKALGLQMALDLIHKEKNIDLITGLKTRTQTGRPNWDKVYMLMLGNRI
uniref:Plastocyanin-like domain-containing protein n=2 Tax=Amphimedon queenslandica TaxID=400682 RepID=A0A1X7T9R0_AMPQE